MQFLMFPIFPSSLQLAPCLAQAKGFPAISKVMSSQFLACQGAACVPLESQQQ